MMICDDDVMLAEAVKVTLVGNGDDVHSKMTMMVVMMVKLVILSAYVCHFLLYQLFYYHQNQKKNGPILSFCSLSCC